MNELQTLLENFIATADDLKERIDCLEKALDRQGLCKMAPGQVVTSDVCEKIHNKMVDEMRGLFSGFTKGISFRLYASWAVLVMILGGLGMALQNHDRYIHELLKVVSK